MENKSQICAYVEFIFAIFNAVKIGIVITIWQGGSYLESGALPSPVFTWTSTVLPISGTACTWRTPTCREGIG